MAGERTQQSGFSLAELSIVLVIVALIIGAVFSGQQLIKASKMRSTISQMDSYNSSFSTFRSKYNCLPGDCLKASSYYLGGGASNKCHNGNGDGKISTDNFFPAAMMTVAPAEKYNVWCHLENAKLMTGNLPGVVLGTASPASASGYFPTIKYGAKGYVLAATLENLDNASGAWSFGPAYLLFGDWSGGLPNFGSGWPLPALTAEEALNIDTKMDDGQPLTGIVRPVVWLGASSNQEFWPDDSTGAGCVDQNNAYDVQGVSYNHVPVHAASAYHPEYIECILAVGANW